MKGRHNYNTIHERSALMKKQVALFGIVALSIAGLIAAAAQAQEKTQQPGQQPPRAEMDETMKKWMEFATPGDAHKRLNDLVGTFVVESKAWMGGPHAQPSVTKGSAEFKWIIGGRFLQQDFKGEMMGMPLTGLGINGYDNFKKKYTGVWIDNSATALYMMEGTLDQSGTVITYYGTADDPTTGEHDKMMKYILRKVNKDKYVFEMHDMSIGEPDTKMVEMTYTRKK
jgi:hypothetical protein